MSPAIPYMKFVKTEPWLLLIDLSDLFTQLI